jgi:hypothetical protein
MSIQDKKITQKRGRPATGGAGRLVGVRVRPDLSEQIDGWRALERPIPSEPEAIRRLVELGLSATPKLRPSERLRASRAVELAAKTIEKIIEPAAPPEERDQRRRRLTKGPSEFREDHVDLPKAKK